MIAVCLKWVELRPEVDPVSGAVHEDARFAGSSDADQAALEWALRCAESWQDRVLAVTAGPPAAEIVLRDALARGAAEAVRVDLIGDAPSTVVAAALAPVVQAARLIWCGDYSVDRGTGSVPAFLAARTGAAQALGLVGVELGPPGEVGGVRRLDGGRRERLRVVGPAVLSVEGSTTRPRRASLAGSLSARTAPVEVVAGPTPGFEQTVSSTTHPFRPRPRILAAPSASRARDRIVALTTAASGASGRSDPVVTDPDDAAARIIAALAVWGYGHEM